MATKIITSVKFKKVINSLDGVVTILQKYIVLVGFIFVTITFIKTEKQTRYNNILSAWKILSTKTPGNSGKKEALETLVREKKSLFGIDLSYSSNGGPVYLKGVNLSRENQLKNIAGPYLSDSSLVNLMFANFEGANLWKASFKESNLKYANFRNAQLQEVDFKSSFLHNSDFTNSFLFYSNFENSDLHYAKFTRSNLSNVNFTGSKRINHKNFEDCYIFVFSEPPLFDKGKLSVEVVRNKRFDLVIDNERNYTLKESKNGAYFKINIKNVDDTEKG
jgi:uncharacterized protein YjbI with pentapeptide repeats